MSRTLSRPMFRLGGSTSGITSGLDKPKRTGYNVGGPGGYAGQQIDYDKFYETSQRITDKYYPKKGANLNRFLIDWGLNMVGNHQVETSYRPQPSRRNDQPENFLQAWINRMLREVLWVQTSLVK